MKASNIPVANPMQKRAAGLVRLQKDGCRRFVYLYGESVLCVGDVEAEAPDVGQDFLFFGSREG